MFATRQNAIIAAALFAATVRANNPLAPEQTAGYGTPVAINPLQAAPTDLPVAADTGYTGETQAPATAPVEGAAPAVPKVKLPQDEQLAADIAAIDEQIAVLTKRREGKAQLLANLDKLANIVPGTILTVTQGRAETLRQVTGVVVAVQDGKYKLSVGEGFEAIYVIVSAPQIVEVGA